MTNRSKESRIFFGDNLFTIILKTEDKRLQH